MSSVSDLFKKVPVHIPYSSGFDKSHRSSFTGTTGTLIPVLVDELIPNTHISLSIPFTLQMPPLASDTFMNVNYKLEAFFVPTRLLMASDSYERWLTGQTDIKYNGDNTVYKLRTPCVLINSDYTNELGVGSLADYLGICSDVVSADDAYFCGFPFLAYHEIYNSWYRNSLIQTDIYDPTVNANYRPATIHTVIPSTFSDSYIFAPDSNYADSVEVSSLRQRNFGLDYFTSSTLKPQNGPSIGVNLEFVYDNNDPSASRVRNLTGVNSWPVGYGNIDNDFTGNLSEATRNNDVTGNTRGFTIASLRAANSLQMFLEKQNIAGNRLVDYVKANYGADLSDAIAQRPVYIGSSSTPVYTHGIFQTAGDSASTNNPFGTVGSNYGTAKCESSSFHIEYKTNEPGYLMVIGSLVPDVSYGSGIDRMFRRYIREDSRTDMANATLQNVGPQPIYMYEADKNFNNDDSLGIFGFVDRYADFMTKLSRTHGLLRDGSSLESFVLQRSLNVDGISDQFLQIPTDFLDQVMAVTNANAGFSYWCDMYFDYKVSMPLQRYSIPSLQDPAYEHGNTIMLRRGGVRID